MLRRGEPETGWGWGWGRGRAYGLLGSLGSGDVHLLGLGLVDFLGRHVEGGLIRIDGRF
jgi:hypothetical protein